MFACKMIMAPLPNIEPVSLLVIIYTVFFGRRALYCIYVYAFLEFAVFGMGLWVINYFYVWTILWGAAYLLRRMKSPLGWAVLAGAFGLMFGALCAPVYFLSGGWAYALSWWVSGLYFDLLHCAGNFVVVLVLFKPCCIAMERAQKAVTNG